MRAWRWLGLTMVASLSLLLGAAIAPPTTVYLALGDSIAEGVGASAPATSYVGREWARLRAASGASEVRLERLATGGATSDGLLRWQAPIATDDLTAMRLGERPGLRPGPITITIGGNDLIGLQFRQLLGGTAPDRAAVLAAVEGVERNLTAALDALVAAGGPTSHITVTTYYNPTAAPARGGNARVGVSPDLAAFGTAALNQAILRAASHHPDQVRVARVDLALPTDAGIARYLADALHPNDQGHARIAEAVARAWDDRPSGG